MLVTVYITVADYWNLRKDIILKFYAAPERHGKYFEQYVLPEIGMLKVAEVNASDIERVVRKIYEAGKSKSMTSMVSALIRKFFHQAAIERLKNEDILKTLKQ